APPRARLRRGARRGGRRVRDGDLSRARGAGAGREWTTDRRRVGDSPPGHEDRLGARARERWRDRRGLGTAWRHRSHAGRRRRRSRCRDGAGAARVKIEEGVELSRYTTLGTGGPVRGFARPETAEEVAELLHWAAERDTTVAVVGLGSNLLAADAGVDALVL